MKPMRIIPKNTVNRTLGALWVLTLLLAGCADAPKVTSVPGGTASFALAPTFVLDEAQEGSALDVAFDRVNRFRVVLTRIPGGELALDATVQVQPGQSVYDLSFDVELWSEDETFAAVITALDDDVVLFTSPPITVYPTLSGGTAPSPVNIPLRYSGPGATATNISVSPAGVALSPGGSQGFSVQVTDASGSLLADVPVAWSVDDPASITVNGQGVVQATQDGKAQVTVTTPTGLSASAWIYVISGEIAYVRDGRLFLGPISTEGGTELTPEAQEAGAPAWSRDGSALYYHDSGKVWKVGQDDPLGDGENPAVHPDGTKLAVDRDGAVYYMNADGSAPTQGLLGSNPQWDVNGEHLFLTGGSLQRVRADDRDRRTLDNGSGVRFPFSCICGENMAYLQGGGVYTISTVGGGKRRVLPQDGQELTAVSRPTMSDDGTWVLAAATGPGGSTALYLTPADGDGPALMMAGSEGATDPAWKPQGSLMATPEVSVTGYEPEEPEPGDELVISGEGFDWIIPANNEVLFPQPPFTPSSPEADENGIPGEILDATAGTLRTRVPEAVGIGQITVGTASGGQGNTSFTPAPGFILVEATKPPAAGVQGVQLQLMLNGEEVGTATTGANGRARFDRMETGVYQLHATPPEGFVLAGTGEGLTTSVPTAALENPQEVRLGSGQTVTAPVPLEPLLHSVTLIPRRATVDVSGSTWFSAQLLDITGDPFPNPPPFQWSAGTDHISVLGHGQRGLVTGIYPTLSPGDASLVFTVQDQMRTAPVTVTSYVQGRVTNSGGGGLGGMLVTATRNGQFLGSASTGADGRYFIAGVPGGTLEIQVSIGGGLTSEPTVHSVTLDKDHPTGMADFVVRQPVPEGDGGIVVFGDLNLWGSGSYYLERADHMQLTENLTTNGDRTGVVWYFGHNSWVGNPESYFGYAMDWVRNTLGRDLTVVTSGTSGSLSIPDGAAAFWLWLPQDPLNADDMDEIRRYVEGGGLVVLLGENYLGTFDAANTNVQNVMTAMGSGALYVDGCLYGAATDIADHPLMKDVNSVEFACTSTFIPGTGDTVLVTHSGSAAVILLGAGGGVETMEAESGLFPPAPPGAGTLADPTDPRRVSPGSGGTGDEEGGAGDG